MTTNKQGLSAWIQGNEYNYVIGGGDTDRH